MRDFRFFKASELACKCNNCDGGEMDPGFMLHLIAMREEAGFPFHLSSAYRCPEHNSQVSSTGRDGPHTTGKAADILCNGGMAQTILKLALKHGMVGIGVNQKGPHQSRFIHVDTARNIPATWSY